MNIAIFTDTYYPEINGVATSSVNLAKILRKHGHKVLVVTTNPFSKELTFEEDTIRIPGFELKALYGYRATNIYSSKAMKIIKEFRPEVVHCQTDVGVGIFGKIVANYLHIGSVYTFHTMIEDYAYYVTKGHFDRASRKIVQRFYRHKSHKFDEIVSPSLKIKEYLRGIGVDENISIIPTGIELERFSITLDPKEEVLKRREKYGIKKDDIVLLFLGRIASEKSIDIVIRGMKKFMDKYKKTVKLIITGLGPAEKELKDLAASLGISDFVIFTGKCLNTETPLYYHLADIFVCASTTETQGLTYIEAMASSDIVLARFDTNLEDLIKEGNTGFFFFNEDDFGHKLNKILKLDQAKREKIISNALNLIDLYSMENFYNNIIGVYKRVARKRW
ncbi:MAG: glycosyltransferase [Bacilli bacterium]|nr:glycosyltransferase [Bacilli bacterium]